MSAPTIEEMREVARRAIEILEGRNIRCCLFGSAACSLYGTSRCPNDVDLIALDSRTSAEDLKQLLVEADDRFYMLPSRTPGATHKVLWYSLDDGADDEERDCKVDILTPGGDLNIPFVSEDRIVMRHDLPVLPLIPLLLLKLQGWADHRDSDQWSKRQKRFADVEDIDELLLVACNQHLRLSSAKWLSGEFVAAAENRVLDYVDEYPESSLYWLTVGFTID